MSDHDRVNDTCAIGLLDAVYSHSMQPTDNPEILANFTPGASIRPGAGFDAEADWLAGPVGLWSIRNRRRQFGGSEGENRQDYRRLQRAKELTIFNSKDVWRCRRLVSGTFRYSYENLVAMSEWPQICGFAQAYAFPAFYRHNFVKIIKLLASPLPCRSKKKRAYWVG